MAAVGSRPLSPEVRERKMQEVRTEVRGLLTAVMHARTDEDWAALGKRHGFCQRRCREIAGQGKGG